MSQFLLLKDRRFLPLFITQFCGAFNDNVFKNALIILITYYFVEQSGLDVRIMVTLAAGVFILPFFLFSAIAGQLADKYEKSALIRAIKIAEILLMSGAALGFYFESLNALLVILFLMGTQSAFFGPLKYGILPDHLKERELIGANALVEAGTFLAILLGTICGGAIILKHGGAVWVSVLVISVAVMGWFASSKILQTVPAEKSLKIEYNIALNTWRIITHSFKNREVFLSIIGISWFWLLGFVFLAQIPVYGKVVLGGNEDVVTLLLTIFSLGIGLGSLVCNKLLKDEIKLNYAPPALAVMSLVIFILWLLTPEAHIASGNYGLAEVGIKNLPVFACFFLISALGGVYIVPLYAAMQSRCLPGYRSRTVAANNVINAMFMVAGAFLTMAMLKAEMRIEDIFLSLAVINIPVGILICKTGGIKHHL